MAKRKNWFSLFFTNYLGVLNDNFLKTLACFICIAWVGKENESMVVTLASAALVIPYLLFSPLAGRLAKIYKKRKIVVWAKFAEMLIMVVAAAGFLMHSTVLVLSSILLMGLQSALFSPSKYGLIRDIGGEEGISYGSGAMEMFAFVGILTGTLMAAFLSESVTIPVLCVILFGVALLGWLSSLTIRANESEPMKESHETLNPVKFVKDMFVRALAFKGLNWVVVGLATFWFIGSMIQMVLIVYCRSDLGMSDSKTGIVMSLAVVGLNIFRKDSFPYTDTLIEIKVKLQLSGRFEPYCAVLFRPNDRTIRRDAVVFPEKNVYFSFRKYPLCIVAFLYPVFS